MWLTAAAALMWSMAGVVTRQLEAARSFKITFWRSAFSATALVLLLAGLHGLVELRRVLLCWSRWRWARC